MPDLTLERCPECGHAVLGPCEEHGSAVGGSWKPAPGDEVRWKPGEDQKATVLAVDGPWVWLRDPEDEPNRDDVCGWVARVSNVEPWVPSPRTERVPWWEAVGRDLAISSWPNRRIEAVSFDEIDGKAWCRTKHGDEVLAEQGQWADAEGRVEVLVEETQEAPR